MTIDSIEQCSSNYTVKELFPEYVKNIEWGMIICTLLFLYFFYKMMTAKNKDDEYQERKIKEEIDLDSKILRMSEEDRSHKDSYDQYQQYKQYIREIENDAESLATGNKHE